MSDKPTSGQRERARDLCLSDRYDVVVVGSGPNGLACAISMIEAGCSVLIVEAQPTFGGGCRTLELTLPGFKNDICSAVHPLGMGSPFFRTLPLEEFGLRWINPKAAYVHAFEPGRALVVERDLEATAKNLGAGGESFSLLMQQLYPDWEKLCDAMLHPMKLFRYAAPVTFFGAHALLSARVLVDRQLQGEESKAAFAGVAAHATTPLDTRASAAIGLSLAIAAHAVGWPIPEGGAQAISSSLVQYFQSTGGELVADCPVRSLDDLPACRFLFLDITPGQFVDIAEDRLSDGYKKRMRAYKYGPGCFKMDWALDGEIPWSSPDFLKAPTVHIGGTFDEIARSEKLATQGKMSSTPFVLLAQPSQFDASRAPDGKQSVWAYCHVPSGYTEDVSDLIEARIERFAPGFRNRILMRSKLSPQQLQKHNENHVGGDINGGALTFSQLLTRPIPRLIPYKTALPNVYLCSSSTPPGSGVHGLCGYYAAWFARNIGSKNQMAISSS